MSFKVVLTFGSGGEEKDDEVFETEEEAEGYALKLTSDYRAGGVDLHGSNPGDYPDNSDEEVDYRIVDDDD